MPVGVLIVEDSRMVRDMLGALLASAGDYQVVASMAGETEATDWMLRNHGRWDLALLDLLLADGSGFTLIQRCKLQPQAGAVAVFSDYVTKAIARRCCALGADAAFSKDQVQELASYLEQLARQPRPGSRAAHPPPSSDTAAPPGVVQ